MRSYLPLVISTRVLGDLGVHCTASDFSGRWAVHVYQVNKGSATCGYSSPNTNAENVVIAKGILAKMGKPHDLRDFVQKHIPEEGVFVSADIHLQTKNPKLGEGYVSTQVPANGEESRWTPLFDQGVAFMDTTVGRIKYSRMLAYSLFDCEGESCENPNPEVSPDSSLTKGYTSHCEGTLIGWALREENQSHMDCFVALKASSSVAVSPHPDGKAEDGGTEVQAHIAQCKSHDSLAVVKDDAADERFRNAVAEVNALDLPPFQGNCGDCYAHATVFALEVSYRLQRLELGLLKEAAVRGTFATQGCKGGYPLALALALAKTNPSVSPYFGFVGGYFGACSENLIITHLREKGPVVVGIDIPSPTDFDHADSYTAVTTADGEKIQVYTHRGRHFASRTWEFSNHAMAIVDYGEADGVKFWKLRNSWGPQWESGGYVYILRGGNLGGVDYHAMSIFAQ